MSHACNCRFPVSILMSFLNKNYPVTLTCKSTVFIVHQNEKWDCYKSSCKLFPDAFYYEQQSGLVSKTQPNQNSSFFLSRSWVLENLNMFLKPEVRPKLSMWSPHKNSNIFVKFIFFSLWLLDKRRLKI